MTVVDWLIVAFTALLAFQGYLRGFIVGVLSLVGFAAGALLGTRLGLLILPGGTHSTYAPLFGLVAALLAGGVLATGFEGIGRAARRVIRIPGLRLADRLAGALLTGCVGLAIAWVVGAVMLVASSSPALRTDIQRSAILRGLNELLPPAGPVLGALARFDPLPSVAGQEAEVPAPTRRILATAGVRDAAPGVVRVIGTACGLGIEGSGWVAGSGLVVTNAHVVAGESDTTIQLGGVGTGLRAIPIVFDSRNDIAILSVPGLERRVLRIAATPRSGTAAAILGYPEDGRFDAQPGRLGATHASETEDAYGNGPVLRQIASLRGLVRPGNSGGPMVGANGEVIATVFAAITNAPHGRPGGFAVPNSVVERELKVARARPHEVGSGHCAE